MPPMREEEHDGGQDEWQSSCCYQWGEWDRKGDLSANFLKYLLTSFFSYVSD
jgi:hypothetical protein